jgi:2-polyprenyl-6-hydroxyphenyl methylase/3-demethylubiquinone-9 3-methyltransferase
VLGWVERGTHDWNKFLRPGEIVKPLEASGLREIDRAGVIYHPIGNHWGLSGDTDVNYMVTLERPA